MRHQSSLRLILFTGLVLSLATAKVEASGYAEIQLLNYSNPSGVVRAGKVCDSILGISLATSQCDHTFEMCVSSSNEHRCDLASISKQHEFSDTNMVSNAHFQSKIHNVSVKFTASLDSVYVRVLAFDTDSPSAPSYELTSDFKRTIVGVKPNFKWTPLQVTDGGTTLWFSVRARCDPSYYGDSCTRYCRNSSDHSGHYVCDSSGSKQCSRGWTGEECTVRISTTKPTVLTSTSTSTTTPLTSYVPSSIAIQSDSVQVDNASTESPHLVTQHLPVEILNNTTLERNESQHSLARFASVQLSEVLAVVRNPWIISALVIVLVLAFAVSVALGVFTTRAKKRKQRVRESSQCVLLRADSQTNGNTAAQTEESTYDYANVESAYVTVNESAPGRLTAQRNSAFKRLLAWFSRKPPVRRSTEATVNVLDINARATLISNVYTSANEYSEAHENRASRVLDLDNIYTDPEHACTVETVRLTNEKPSDAANSGIKKVDDEYSTPMLQLLPEETTSQVAHALYSVPISADGQYSVPLGSSGESNYSVPISVDPNYSVPINGLYASPVS